MATWEITTEYKKSSIERQFWYNGDKVIIREEGYRWGTFRVESDTIPLTSDELKNEDDWYELSVIDNDESWELVDLTDGCWADVEKGRNCTDEDLEAFENAWEENYYEGVEELGWTHDDTEFYMSGPLKLTNLDTGVEYSGLTDPTTVVHTIELTTEEVLPELAPIVDVRAPAKWPFATGTPYDETVTDWFPSNINPVRDGFYECHTQTEAWPFPNNKMLEWANGSWNDEGTVVDIKDIVQWRGLANNPVKE
jgi:hypothetical protein